jgi:DNA-binding MarR family transcriptional regulator
MPRRPPLTKTDFESLSEFRYQLRRFLRFSEDAAHAEGLTPLQYQLLLHVKGYPGRDWATIGELAERLQAQHHGVVALVSRCEQAGLVTRVHAPHDRRQVQVHLSARGVAIVTRVANLHRAELASLSSVFQVAKLTAYNERSE